MTMKPFWFCGAVLMAAAGASVLTLQFTYRHPLKQLTKRAYLASVPAPPVPLQPSGTAASAPDDRQPEVIDLSIVPAVYRPEGSPSTDDNRSAANLAPAVFLPVVSSPVFSGAPDVMPKALDNPGADAAAPAWMPPAAQEDPNYPYQYPGVVPAGAFQRLSPPPASIQNLKLVPGRNPATIQVLPGRYEPIMPVVVPFLPF